MHPESDTALRERILDTALQLGEERGWDALHLHEIAAALQLPLAALLRHYPQQDALVEAWFDRADAALVATGEAEGWAGLSPRQRLQQALWAWLQALAPHRRLTAAMLGYKLQPEHLHLQLLGLLRISRTVQTWREVALLRSSGWRRELEEAALTAIYLSSLARWLGDDSPGATRSQAWLAAQLDAAEWLARRGSA